MDVTCRNLSGNQIVGGIPSTLSTLTKLENLDILGEPLSSGSRKSLRSF
jgi:hypothetical protein